MTSILTIFAALLVGYASAAKAPVPPTPPPPAAPEAPTDPLAVRPTVGAETAFEGTVPAARRLSNGASVWLVERPGVPLVSAVISIPGGSSVDPRGRDGAAWLSDRLKTQGAGARDAAAFAAEVERLGVQLDVRTERHRSVIAVSTLSANLPAALDLVADMILRPRYGAADVKRERTLAIGSVKLGFEDPVTVASRLGAARWFGEGHPYARPPEGTPSGLARLGKKDVLSYHRRAWSSAGATLTLAGDLSMDAAIALLEPRLGAAWPAGDGARVSVPPASPAAGKVFLVDRPGSAQTMFYLVFAAPPAGDPRSPAARNGTIVLGGTFTSRLNALLREKRGYTYGARARLSQMPGAGVYVVSTRIRTDATGPAMTDLLAELGSLRAGVTTAEVAKARSAFRQDMVETMSSRAGIAEAYAELHAAGLPPDAFSADLRATGALAPADVAPTLGAYDVAAGVVVLVGDRAVIEAPLRAAGVGTIEVVAPY